MHWLRFSKSKVIQNIILYSGKWECLWVWVDNFWKTMSTLLAVFQSAAGREQGEKDNMLILSALETRAPHYHFLSLF